MDHDSYLADYYPEDFDLDCYYKRYFWMCEPILPNIDFERINKYVKEVKLTKLESEEQKIKEVYYKGVLN